MKRTSLNRSFAKQHPESVFASPLDIVGERLLTRGEKLGTLDRWHQSIVARLPVRGEIRASWLRPDQARLLGQIEEAKRLLTGNMGEEAR